MNEIDLNEVWYVCPFAGFLTKNKDHLKAHMARKHDVGIHPFKNKCDSKEANREALEALEQTLYVCFLCDGHGVWPLKFFRAKEREDLLHHLAPYTPK